MRIHLKLLRALRPATMSRTSVRVHPKENRAMARLTSAQREAIIKRRGHRSDKDKKKHWSKNLEIHHKDRDPKNNDPANLRVLTKEEHDELHRRAGH